VAAVQGISSRRIWRPEALQLQTSAGFDAVLWVALADGCGELRQRKRPENTKTGQNIRTNRW
jgi:hypothetical protein